MNRDSLQKAGNDAIVVFGLAGLQKAENDAGVWVGLAGVQKAATCSVPVGVGLYQKAGEKTRSFGAITKLGQEEP